MRPSMRKIASDASMAATKEVVRGCLDFVQRHTEVGPRLGTAMNAANALEKTNSMLKIYTEYYLRRWKNMLSIKHKSFPENYDLITINQQNSLTSMTEHLLLQYTEFDSVNSYLQGYSITGDRLKSLSINSDVYIAEDDPVIPHFDHENLYSSKYLNIHLTNFGGHCGYLNSMFSNNWIDEEITKKLQA